jgi:hypothetical protein
VLDQTAPILLLSREDAICALDLAPAVFDRRIRDGKLPLEDCVVAGSRELYRRDAVREVILQRAAECIRVRGPS